MCEALLSRPYTLSQALGLAFRFEPTPSSGLAQQGATPAPAAFGSGMWDDFEMYMENFYLEFLPGQDQNQGDLADVFYDGEQQGAPFGNIRLPSLPVSAWFGLVTLFVAMLVLIRILFVYWGNSRIGKKENNEAAIYKFKVLISYLDFFGFEMKDNETVIQFAERIQHYFSVAEFEKKMLKSAARVFAKARYSKEEITNVDCEVIEKLIQRMEVRAELQLGKWKYFIYRYILAKV